MKKEVVVAARITADMRDKIQALADADERTVAWMVRKLLAEALEVRGVFKAKSETGKKR